MRAGLRSDRKIRHDYVFIKFKVLGKCINCIAVLGNVYISFLNIKLIDVELFFTCGK